MTGNSYGAWEVNMTEGVTAVSRKHLWASHDYIYDLCRYRFDRFWRHVLLDFQAQKIKRSCASTVS